MSLEGYIGSCIDVTDRIEAQRALDVARERELANLHWILPICMQCRKIRGVEGRWFQLEQYIHDHSRADFSHGLCPECYDLYSEDLEKAQKDGVPKRPPRRSLGSHSLSWRKLVERYAIRAREFSDAVAALGPYARPGPVASRDVLEKIRTRREVCNQVADEVEHYLKPKTPTADGTSSDFHR